MSEAERRALQSTLLRLCVLCATSLQAMHPSQAAQETVDNDVATQDGARLCGQIYNDTIALLQKATKDCTGLSLAMRIAKGKVQDDSDPLEGLDDSSVNAAAALLQSLASDLVPKLVFLTNLAQKNQTVYNLADSAARDESIKEMQKLGAQIVYGEGAKGSKALSASVGKYFAHEITNAMSEVVEIIAQLCQSFMDLKTRTVLERAQARREASPSIKKTSIDRPSRGLTLSLTKRLWKLCDSLSAETGAKDNPSRLPRDNKEAVSRVWKQSTVMVQDGIEELQEAIDRPNDGLDEAGELDELGAQWSQSVQLSEQERKLGKAVLQLLQASVTLQQKIEASLFADSSVTYDYDEAGDRITGLMEAQDDLIAATLYGDDTMSHEEDESDTEEHQAAADMPQDHDLQSKLDSYLGSCQSLSELSASCTSMAHIKDAYNATLAMIL
ncbi:kynureninase [Malassezia yamatoensis]|uniref:Kynureninase n=1 Tax=Malassezia yamatoensis TaxID=253288 RepID=A0AAJ5YR03_9BASI|nr:kynureninase [Malassezia yamatoensis]